MCLCSLNEQPEAWLGPGCQALREMKVGWGLGLGSEVLSNTTLELQLENTHETPQSSRDEGLLLLYGLESNPESSLQTPQEA